jgi:hypothetical protein
MEGVEAGVVTNVIDKVLGGGRLDDEYGADGDEGGAHMQE